MKNFIKIADKELRSINAQLEYFILKGIKDFEASQKDS